MARRDIGERNALRGEFAVPVRERSHCFPGSDGPGAVGGSAGGGADGVDVGGGVVSGAPGAVTGGGGVAGLAAGFGGGSFSGPFMPQEVSDNASRQAMAAAQRRNIPGSRRKDMISMPTSLPESLACRRRSIR